MTAEDLKTFTRKELAETARSHGVAGWHSMKKDELLEALRVLFRKSKGNGRNRRNGADVSGRTSPRSHNGRRNGNGRRNAPAVRNGMAAVPARVRRNLANTGGEELLPELRDRIALGVCDAYWLQARWFLTPAAVARAEAALGAEWHQASPVLRVFEVQNNDTDLSTRSCVQTLPIHGGVDTWYIKVEQPGRTYRVQIGYLTPDGRFYSLARSNSVTTPEAGTAVDFEPDWNSTPTGMRLGNGRPGEPVPLSGPDGGRCFVEIPFAASGLRNGHAARHSLGDFHFQIESELIVYGSTHPEADLSLLGQPVRLRDDGTFAVRLTLPNGRQVVPAVAVTRDGSEQRTIVLAIERNTRELEPQSLEDPL